LTAAERSKNNHYSFQSERLFFVLLFLLAFFGQEWRRKLRIVYKRSGDECRVPKAKVAGSRFFKEAGRQ
jgi:hypothetical protein